MSSRGWNNISSKIKLLQDNQRSISMGKKSKFFLIIPSELPSTWNHLSLKDDFRTSENYLEYDIEEPENYNEYKCCITYKELDEKERADMLKGLEIQQYVSRGEGEEEEAGVSRYPYHIRKVVEYNNYIVPTHTGMYTITKSVVAPLNFAFGEELNKYPHFSTPGNKGIYAVKEDNGVNLLDYLWSRDPISYGDGEDKDFDTYIMFFIFIRLLEAVIYIHEQNCVHRDIHPENIGYVGNDGEMIKLDGFHYAVNTAGDMTGITEKGRKGFYDKELYKSDENGVLIPPSREDLEFSDVYACGVTMIYIAERWRRTKNSIRMKVINDFVGATSYEDRKQVLKKLRVKSPGQLHPFWELYNIMLEAIKYCVVDEGEITRSYSGVTSMFRRAKTRKSAKKILDFLVSAGINHLDDMEDMKDPPGPVILTNYGGKKKTRNKKTRNKKTRNKKTNKNKKTKKSKRLV